MASPDLLKLILELLTAAIAPLQQLISAIKGSSSDEELLAELQRYRDNQPDIRKDLQKILDKYGR